MALQTKGFQTKGLLMYDGPFLEKNVLVVNIKSATLIVHGSPAFYFKHSYRSGYTAVLFLFDDLIDSVKLRTDCEHPCLSISIR